MPECSMHVPGTFCWPELATTDQKGAGAFYHALFGWDVIDSPIGPGEVYSIYEMRGKPVAAGFALNAAMRKQGVPPHWASYVAVADADATAKRVRELGGRVLADPFDVMTYGRTAVLQDPTGAILSLWQAKSHIGAGIVNEIGALGWTELATTDMKTAEPFYTALFGWRAKSSRWMPDYTEFRNQGAPCAGMMKIESSWGHVPPHWLPYFRVADCRDAVARVKALGGGVKMPTKEIAELGCFAVLQDPQGAVFATIQLTHRF